MIGLEWGFLLGPFMMMLLWTGVVLVALWLVGLLFPAAKKVNNEDPVRVKK